MDGMDGRITFRFRPSIRPSIRPSQTGRKIPFSDGKMDGWKYQKGLIFPSVHSSVENGRFPSIFDGRNGRIGGRIGGRKRKVIRPSITSINLSSV